MLVNMNAKLESQRRGADMLRLRTAIGKAGSGKFGFIRNKRFHTWNVVQMQVTERGDAVGGRR